MFKKFSQILGLQSSGEAKEEQAVEYSGFRINVAPIKESSGYRVAARIEKDVSGTVKTHQLIRADVCNSQEEAARVSLLKAKAVIDQLGENIFPN